MRVKRIAATVAGGAIIGAVGLSVTALNGGTASASITSPGAGSSTPVSTISGATNGNTMASATDVIGNTAGGG